MRNYSVVYDLSAITTIIINANTEPRAVLFFFMLYTLGLDSEFALLETVLTGFYDMFPRTRRYKTWLTLAACVVCFLISIPCFSLSGSVRKEKLDLRSLRQV